MQPRDLSDHVAYEAGRGIEEVARELGRDPSEFIKLASNENPHGPSPAAAVAIRETASSVSSYPKAAHADLTTAVADRWGVGDEQVWLANGGDGAIDYLHRAALEPADDVLVPTPGFAYYGMSSRFHHGDVLEYELSRAADFARRPTRFWTPTTASGLSGSRAPTTRRARRCPSRKSNASRRGPTRRP